MRKLLLLLCIGTITYTASAQDPVFSQFYAAPLHLNPAFAGVTYAPRITLNYRNQYPAWPNAYATYSAAYEQSVEQLNSGFGLVLMTDAAGDKVYKSTRISAIYGYQVRVNDVFGIKFGVEAGIIQTTVDWDRLTFGDQLDPITGPVDPGGNPQLSDEQRPESLNKNMFDVSAGLLVYSEQFYAGLSVKHLNTPDEDLLKVNENLSAGIPIRFTLHTGMEFVLERGNNRNSASFISPNIMFIKQGDFGQINGGAYAGAGKIFGGLWYRHTFSNPDAVIALVGFKEGIFRIGYSYDLTLSKLSSAPGGTGGTHEISLSINFEDGQNFKRRRNASRYNDCFKMFN
ncbi:MAG: hypothetical protein DHS20C18_33120 [Saprospiraceae bacterium]|nr:MAG: hypothetical protein DHS20C18_33120 [Saprospiraceae bacterium]